ncbi:hypothetical protein [Hyphomonas sp.]|uniref:hypothetical protein n=1 Tax=Hyphomonas sp. TaxID=87 RepID=UPI00391DB81E
MLAFLRYLPLAASLGLLTACFVSEDALIGQGVRLHDGPVAFCLGPDDPCLPAPLEGDTYLAASGDSGTPMRFVPLTEAGGQPVWLGEAEIREEDSDERAFMILVARPESFAADGTLNIRIMTPDCYEAGEDMRARYGIEQVDQYICATPDLETLSAYLIERHGADFADPDWWEGSN